MNISKNSVVCFIGDSITAAEKFNRILVDYFVLHFPEKHILFHNISIPGTSTGNVLQNWDELITPRYPTHATIMFGMNDLQRSLYSDSAKITDELLQKRENAIQNYMQNISTLYNKLENVSKLIMAPTLHDENPEIEGALYGGYDASLTKAGALLKKNFSPVLDLHAPLADANAKQLVKTVIGPDRVHPGNIGHAIIAYTILEYLGFENPRLPIWDDSYTDEEKAVLAKLGIFEDKAPKNPYSDERSRLQRKMIDYWYVEMNVLAGQGIDKNDTEKADAYLKSKLSEPIEEWRIKSYTEYMKNRHTLPEILHNAEEAMENMYRA